MSKLVCNGSTLYRRASKLVRTPIKIDLTADDMAVYQVAGTYTTNSYPDSGFVLQNTYSNVWAAGYACLQAYSQHADSRQIWRRVNTGHLPETVWYQGAYATSAPTLTAALNSCEAYVQLGAYHFTIPESLRELGVSGATVKFVNGGGVQAYQSPAVHSASNSRLQGKYSFNSWYMPFAVTASLGTIQQIASQPHDQAVDILADYDDCRGARDLWGFTSANRDGGIATMTTPVRRSYTMGASTVAACNDSMGGFWIVPYVDFSVSGPTAYRPYYVTPNNGFWGVISLWDISLTVELG